MQEINAQEANRIVGKGVIALPRTGGTRQLHGYLEKKRHRSRIIGGCLLLSGGRRMPWTPASQIGW
jgi:hypothetical protein